MPAGSVRPTGPTCLGALVALAAAIAVGALVFTLWPGLDLGVSRLAYRPGAGFVLADRPVWDAVVLAGKVASILYVTAALVLLPASLLRRADPAVARYWGLVILLYLIGPGLMVNGALKRGFGRARPDQIELFGGDGPFTAAWQVSGYCRSACSFVSAEVAAGTALTIGLALGALWFAGRPAARLFRRLALAALALLVLTALQRIGSGRHFLSDVVFAALLVAALGAALACLLRPHQMPYLTPHRTGDLP
jgi:lipid A 4'-phosphatase